MEHTPGPWEIKGQHIFGNEQNGYICSWSGKSANASLIASAPDLLGALIQAKVMLEYVGGCQDTVNRCKQAIAKVKGKKL